MAVQLWTADEVVDFFQARGLRDINKKWVQRRCDNGDLPYTLVNNRRRVRQDVVEGMYNRWLAEAT